MKLVSPKKVKISENFYGKPYEITLFGNYGFVFMMFPTIGDEFSDEIDGAIVYSLYEFIKDGLFRVVFVPMINSYFWGEERKYSPQKSNLLYGFNNFLVGEVITYLYKIIGRPTPIITLGCGEKAGFFSANCFFRRPDLFYGLISVDGVFDLRLLCDEVDEGDSNIYFNNPMAFLANLNDDYWLIHMKTGKDINIIAFSNNTKTVDQANSLSGILLSKSIEHRKEIIDIQSSLPVFPEIVKNLVQEIFK